MISVNWPAPAKLNLFLHITGRRPDGYHDLQTVFQFVDYCDYLDFEITDDPIIKVFKNIPDLSEHQGMIWQAAKRLQKYCSIHQGVQVHVRKSIPVGAGLGGGSSNAATALVALNKLWNCQLNLEELAEIGVSLGADVPVFIHGHAAWAEGVGEKLKSINLPEPWYLIVYPRVSLSTATLFSDPDLTRDRTPIKIADFLNGGELTNVFLPIAIKHSKVLARCYQQLSVLAHTRLTGSGSCLFMNFDSDQELIKVKEQITGDLDIFVARGLNQSPLHQRVETLLEKTYSNKG